MTFDFGRLIAHAARTRRLSAGSIIGSGTISNKEAGARPAGARAAPAMPALRSSSVETIRSGQPATPFLRSGDRLRIEMLGDGGASISAPSSRL
jgi:fumarylacetoacetate (FAA) hydrolase